MLFGTWLTYGRNTMYALQAIVLLCFLLSTVVWINVASKNTITLEVLKNGWYIILIAMVISSSGGYVLKFAVQRFKTLAAFQPVINGVGGNLVAVQASKISTYLHRFGKIGQLPANTLLTYANPMRTFMFKGNNESRIEHNMVFRRRILARCLFTFDVYPGTLNIPNHHFLGSGWSRVLI